MQKRFKAIPIRLFKRLFKLTSTNNKLLKSRVEEIYPEHIRALKLANHVPNQFLNMNKIELMIENSNNKKEAKENLKRKSLKTNLFCIGIYNAWKGENAIHLIFKKNYVKNRI